MKMGVVLVLVLVTVSMVCAGTTGAQSSCTRELLDMLQCLSYISGNSSTPSSACCTQFGIAVRSQPDCLCQVFNGGGSLLGVNLNQTLALTLPSVCNLQTPPIFHCNAASPAESPNSNPSETGSANGSSSVNLSIPLLFLVVAVAVTYAPTFGTQLIL